MDKSGPSSPPPLAEDAPPYVPPPSQAPTKRLLPLRATDGLRWLSAGWRDMRRHPGISLFYGISFWLMALLLGAVFRSQPQYTMSFASGCLLVGPFLAMGLYDVSRRLEHDLPVALGSSATCWERHLPSMGLMVLVLVVLELLWGRASLVVFAIFFNTGMPSTSSVLEAVFNPQNWEFVAAYTAVGGVFAALAFGVAVVSMPMILDRDLDGISASVTSLQVVYENTGVMLLWGLTITVLVALALLSPWCLGLLLVGPLLGHASWHAYRSAVEWL